MSIPLASEKAWSDILSGQVRYDFECFALKILLGRLNLIVEREPAKIQACASQLREFFVKNAQLPSAQRDLKKIFG